MRHPRRLHVYSGMNLLDALKIARHLGCLVEPKRGTGEVVVRHPWLPFPIPCSVGEKDAPRVLTQKLRTLRREQGYAE